MKFQVLADSEAVAKMAAALVAAEARDAAATRGRFAVAVSGGRTPWQMLHKLANEDVPSPMVHVVQVDERVAPPGDPDRNLTHLKESLLEDAPMRPGQIYAMPVETTDLNAAAREYAQTLEKIARSRPMLDLIHLGLGRDGHTASLVPGDAARHYERGRCCNRRLSGSPPHDIDLSDCQPGSIHPVARDTQKLESGARRRQVGN